MRSLTANFTRRGFGYVLLLTTIVTLTGAAGMYAFERETADAAGFDSYGTALWWTAMLMTTMVKSQRECWNKISTETKYYISSWPSDVAKIAGAIRSHWSIEKRSSSERVPRSWKEPKHQLHWFLDVVFGEDDSRIRKDYGAENFGTLRRLALGLLQRETSLKKSIRLKRYRASMNNDYLLKVLLS